MAAATTCLRCSVDPITGDTDFTSDVRASAAIALYVAGAGGVLALIGGTMMHNSDPLPVDAPAAAGDSTATKECPECAETVQVAARVCRYCGYRFEGPAISSVAPQDSSR